MSFPGIAQGLTIVKVQEIVDSTTKWINHGDYDRSFELLIQNEEQILKLKPEEESCIYFNLNLAKTFTIRRNYKLALAVLKRTEVILPRVQNPETKALILISFADFYRTMENFQKCDHYFTLARKHVEFRTVNFNRALFYNRLAATYTQKKDIAKSIFYSKLCIDISLLNSYHKLLGLSYNELGFIYYNTDDFEKSKFFYLKGMEYSIKSGNLFDWANSAMNFIILCYKNKRYAVGEPLLDSLISLSTKKDWKEILVRTYRCKSWKAETAGDSLSYYKYVTRYQNLISENNEVNTN